MSKQIWLLVMVVSMLLGPTMSLAIAENERSVEDYLNPTLLLDELPETERKEALRLLIEGTQSKDKDFCNRFRNRCIRTLGELGNPEAVPILCDLLEYKGPWAEDARRAAAQALILLEDRKAYPALLKALNNPDLYEYGKEALKRIVTENDVPDLIERLKKKNRVSSGYAAEFLGELGDPRAITALGEAATYTYLGLRRAVKADEAGCKAMPWDGPGDYDFRWKAAEALGKIRDKTAVPYLLKALNDLHPAVRREAILSLGLIGDKSVAPTLLELCKETDQDKRIASDVIYEALGAIGDNRALPLLCEALKSETVSQPNAYRGSRQIAARAIGKIGDKKAIPVLREALFNPAFLADFNYNIGYVEIARTLIGMGETDILPMICKIALEEKDVKKRRWAIEILYNLPDKSAIEPLVQALTDKEHWIYLYAAGALVQLGDKRGLETLIKTFEDKNTNSSDRYGVICVLITLENKEIFPTLISALYSDHSDTKRKALKTLEEKGDSRILPALRDYLFQPRRQGVSVYAGEAKEAIRQIKRRMKFEKEIIDLVFAEPKPMDAELNNKIELLIKQLDDDSYQVREQTTKKLISLGMFVIDLLKNELDKTKNPEVTNRVKMVLKELSPLIERKQVADKLHSDPGYMIELLAHNDVTIRTKAHARLKELTHQDLGYTPDAEVSERKKTINKWKTWWTENR